jgi:hypothetical protein
VRKHLAVAGLLLLAFASADTTRAQLIYPPAPMPDAALPPYEVMSIVRSTGLTPMTRPMRRGPYYVLVAVDRFGRQLRVVVDAQLGDVVNLRPAFAAYGPNGLPPVGAPAPDPGPAMPPNAARPNPDNALASPPPRPPAAHTLGDIGSAPPPARSVPEAHAPNVVSSVAPPRLAVAEPTSPSSPPLPRPRPKITANAAPTEPPVVKPLAGPADDDKIE